MLNDDDDTKTVGGRVRTRSEGVVLVLFAIIVPLSALGVGAFASNLACRERSVCVEVATLPHTILTCTTGTDTVGPIGDTLVGAPTSARACAFVACPSRLAVANQRLKEAELALAGTSAPSGGLVPVSSLVDSPLSGLRSAFVAQWRGACAFGMRTIESTRCVIQLSWPGGLIVDAMDVEALSVSRRACGRWMGSYTGPANVEYSFMDIAETTIDLWLLTEAIVGTSNTLVPGRATKIVSECRATILGGPEATQLAAQLAYDRLKTVLGVPKTVHDVAIALGELAARRCPGPVRLHFLSDEQGFKSTVVNGVMPTALEVENAMEWIGVDVETIVLASDTIWEVNLGACGGPTVTSASEGVPHAVVEGIVSGLVGSEVSLGPTPDAERVALTLMRSTLCTLGGPSTTLDTYAAQTKALALLRGLAANCVDIVVGRMIGDGGVGEGTIPEHGRHLWSSNVGRHRRAPTPSLGRVSAWGRPDSSFAKALAPPTAEEWTAVSTGVLARQVEGDATLHDTATVDSDTEGPTDGCFDTIRYAAVTVVEEALFFVVVPPVLYQRLEGVVDMLRKAVAYVVVYDPIVASLFANPDAVAESVLETRLRISGAPSGTWAGRSLPRAYTSPDHGSGPANAILEHILDETRDWLGVIFASLGKTCDARPIREASEPNGYYLYPHGCVVLMLGLLHMPLADEAYDDETTLSRIGFVIAHEFAHASMSHARLSTGYNDVLQYYSSETREEALADIVAMRALETLLPGRCEEVILHVAQVFCRSNGPEGSVASAGAHPVNRGDTLARTMYEKFETSCGGWE